MQRWFIITSVQGYGHVAQDPRNDHECVKAWVCNPRPTQCRDIIGSYSIDSMIARDPHIAGT